MIYWNAASSADQSWWFFLANYFIHYALCFLL